MTDHGHRVLSDLTPEKMREADAMAEIVAGLSTPDLLRVVAASIHEMRDRAPHLDDETILRTTIAEISDLHGHGLA